MDITRSARRSTLVALACSAGLLIAACGGGGEPGAAIDTPAARAERGNAAPSPAAEPADAGARTNARLYLSEAQAQALSRTWRGRVVWVPAEGSGLEAAELAVLIAYGNQIAADLPGDVPFIVQGANLRQAAAVANRLTANGAPRVFLVTR